ncbi:hypothetical protein RhiJN_16776 [Ceratobasidium sp. AG-Ba]|nr:hypothetical protein RhiJN_16776 [Ceratobasidium sp. AG-Ba]
MFSRLVLSFFVLSALLAVALAEHVPRSAHHKDELHARGKPKGRGGRGTWYTPGLGNCGGHNNSKDMVVALSTKSYGGGKYCGKKIKITNKKNGKSCTATIVDSCPGCAAGDLDLSPAAFKKMAPLDDGVMPVDWDFV